MITIKEVNDSYNEGIRKDDTGHFIFDTDFDFSTDLIMLHKDSKGFVNEDGLTYYYAYEFNPKTTSSQQKEFRDALKHKLTDPEVFYGDEATQFVMNGIHKMNDMKNLNDFEVVVSTANHYGDKTLTGLMCSLIWEELNDSTFVLNIQLIKKLCSEVTFDRNKAKEALRKTNRYGSDEIAIENALDKIEYDFNKEKKSGNLFTMKKYQPVAGRAGFMDFLKFANQYDQKLYEALKKGTEVLICDDFITSGTTVKEIIRFLNSINPNNNISVFVLINQLRKY